MKYLSLFSGIGGFELGIEQAYVETTHGTKNGRSKSAQAKGNRKGHTESKKAGPSKRRSGKYDHGFGSRQKSITCVGYSEIDKHAIQIYEKHFKHKNYGDIKKIKPETLPRFGLLVAGFPCQAFSIAGKRKGFDDTRGTLFFDIARIVRVRRPRLLLLENVKGLLSHDEGRTFAVIIRTLDELGYDIQWQVLNSSNFGVPQNRERVYIIGHLRGTARPKIFPLESTSETTDARRKPNDTSREIAQTIRTRYGNGSGSHIQQVNDPKHSNDRVYHPKGIGPTLNTMQGGNRQPFVLQKRKMIRRLTPIECERLQGFPDGWTEGISDTQRYKCLGNGVTVNVVREIARRLLLAK